MNEVALTAVQALWGLISSDVIAVAVVAGEEGCGSPSGDVAMTRVTSGSSMPHLALPSGQRRRGFGSLPGYGWSSSRGRDRGDAFCFVGEGGAERLVVLYVSLYGEAGPIGRGLPELVRLSLVVPWWRDAPGRTDVELRAVADEYREDVPGFDRRRDRAARALGLDPAGLPSAATALARLVEFARGPVSAECLVVGYDSVPLAPLFARAARHR